MIKLLAFARNVAAGKSRSASDTAFSSILLISSTAIGDTLLSTPVFTAFRQQNPSATIKTLIRDKFCPMFRDNPDLDGVIPFRKGFTGFLRTLCDIRKNRFQAAFVLHTSDPNPVFLCTLANIPLIVGKSFDPALNALYTRVVTPNPKDHAIVRRMLVAKTLYPERTSWPSTLVLPLQPEKVAATHRQFQAIAGLPAECDLVVGFQPGASREFKMWPAACFVALGKRLLSQNPRMGILILGAPNEKNLGQAIEQGIGDSSRARSLCGATPLTDLPYLTERLNCLVTNDTGTLHIAIAVKTPTVSLFVPTDVPGTGPYQDLESHRVISKPRPCGDDCVRKKCTKTPPCMTLITVDEVYQAVMETLQL
ncbi:MAG: glycosyltransferase family 9 protein [Desulfuromonadaceae bacterium]